MRCIYGQKYWLRIYKRTTTRALGSQVDKTRAPDEKKRKIRRDIPEIWQHQYRAVIREFVVGRVLGDRIKEENRSDQDRRQRYQEYRFCVHTLPGVNRAISLIQIQFFNTL